MPPKDIISQREAISLLFNEKAATSQEDKGVVLFSAGIDSTVLLYLALRSGISVQALEFNYKDRPIEEIERNEEICRSLNIDLISIDFPSVNIKELGPTASQGTDRSRLTLIESNSLYYALAANSCVQIGVRNIFAGQIRSDWEGSDILQNHPGFFTSLNKLYADEYGDRSPRIILPFLHMTKSEVVKIGKDLDLPFEKTWSCVNSRIPCGTCAQCKEREEAFKDNGILIPSSAPINQNSLQP